MSSSPWIIMPAVSNWPMTEQAIYDCLGQTVEPNVLLILQGVDDELRRSAEALDERLSDRIFVWSFVPMLPSLSAVWNRALKFVWSLGGQEALVVNNDVRLA